MALVVITGGARSGKSRVAQNLAQARHRDGQPVVVAVFASQSDAEMTERIDRHRADRPSGFSVIEAAGSADWMTSVQSGSLLLIDCLGTWLGMAMLDTWAATAPDGTDMNDAVELPDAFAGAFETRAAALVDAIATREGDTVVVTNETGSGVVPAFATGRIFRDELGRANAVLTGLADAAYVVVAGRALDLTALPQDIDWPED